MRINLNTQQPNFKAIIREQSFYELGEQTQAAVAIFERTKKGQQLSKKYHIILGGSSIQLTTETTIKLRGKQLQSLTIQLKKIGEGIITKIGNFMRGEPTSISADEVTPERVEAIISAMV